MASPAPEASLDRRHRRRQETIEEILDVALQIMTEQGVGALSLGEVARRIGVRPPSLYVYFASKDAIYDALFARGARQIADAVRVDSQQLLDNLDPSRSLDDVVVDVAMSFLRWTMEHPAYTQLLYWRPVPGFEPSAAAFAPAVEMVETSRQRFAQLQQRGLIRADADIAAVQQDWATIMTGIVTRQLANAPDERFDRRRLSSRIASLLAMFARHYSATTKGPHRAGKR